jgi:flagellin-specific chaperone FliS
LLLPVEAQPAIIPQAKIIKNVFFISKCFSLIAKLENNLNIQCLSYQTSENIFEIYDFEKI